MIDVAFSGMLGQFRCDTAFSVPAKGVTALFGPSGCGKTSVLRCVAGLQRLEGYCRVDGEVWQDESDFIPTHRRSIGYVFQEASLFQHLSVRSNLLFGAPKAGTGPGGVAFDEVVDLFGLGAFLDRVPDKLSGGERQRVALGRALLSQPKLLLMDEPLSALDQRTKGDILPFLERLHERLLLPVLYVSHDMGELEHLADRLVLMEAGRVVACGALHDLQCDPSLPLIRGRDAAVSLDAVVEEYDSAYGLATLAVAGARFTFPAPVVHHGESRRLRIRAGDVSLARERPSHSTILNVLQARIVDEVPIDAHEVVFVLRLGADGAGERLLARVTRRSKDALQLMVGSEAFAQVKGVALV